MFNLFSFISTGLFLFSTLMVLFTTNPVYGIFFLILSFTLISSFFILLGIDMLGLFIIILYVGAIAVLFLFVLMMLNVKTFEYYSSNYDYLYIYGCLFAYFALECYTFNMNSSEIYGTMFVSRWDTLAFNTVPSMNSSNLLQLFGETFFTYFGFHFIAIGLLLLLTMIGAIVLTLSHKLSTKRQLVYVQVNRQLSKTVKLR